MRANDPRGLSFQGVLKLLLSTRLGLTVWPALNPGALFLVYFQIPSCNPHPASGIAASHRRDTARIIGINGSSIKGSVAVSWCRSCCVGCSFMELAKLIVLSCFQQRCCQHGAVSLWIHSNLLQRDDVAGHPQALSYQERSKREVQLVGIAHTGATIYIQAILKALSSLSIDRSLVIRASSHAAV